MPVSVSCSCHVPGEGEALLGFRPPQASVRGMLVRVLVRGYPAVTHVGVVILIFIKFPPAVASPVARWSMTGLRRSLAESPHGWPAIV